MNAKILSCCLLIATPGLSLGAEPEKVVPCYGVNNWATQMTTSNMVELGILKDSGDILNNGKAIETKLLESKRLGTITSISPSKETLYRQIQKISLRNSEGKAFEVITISQVSDSECSMSMPTSILISPEFKVINEGEPYPGKIDP